MSPRNLKKLVCLLGGLITVIFLTVWAVEKTSAAPRADGQLQIEVVDAATGEPIAARIHLKNVRGRPAPLKLPGSAELGDHFYIDGNRELPLRLGQYTFELEATPEYVTQTGHFEIDRHADDVKRIEMKRFTNLAEEGWYGGDLDVSRRLEDLPLIMRAEGLSVVPVTAMSSTMAPKKKALTLNPSVRPPADTKTGSLAFGPFGQLDERLGGGLLLFNLTKPLELAAAMPANPSSLAVLKDARAQNGRAVARTPYAWDFPVWLASGELDAIELIHHHALRNDVVDNEIDGRPRDKTFFPGVTGNGRWSEIVYYHMLNCGLKIPPVAGSGSGTNDSPVGTNRVYVYCGDGFSYERWWEGLEAGQVFVTNGPLLRPTVEGQPPGHVFHLDGRDWLTMEIGLNLATRVPVDYLQIIKNGEVDAEVRLADWKEKKGRLPKLHFDDSGWFLVRAVTSNPKNYQFASSGPYYVEKAGTPRVSRRSVQFFLDWIDAASDRISKLTDISDADRTPLLAEQQSAREYFEGLLSRANVD